LDIFRLAVALYARCVPEISRFLGITMTIYYDDHPPPHFHVRYGEPRAIIDIETMSVIDGRLSPRAHGLVTEWAAGQRPELREDWRLAQEHAPLRPIAPLE
jgi:hypothetical protein